MKLALLGELGVNSQYFISGAGTDLIPKERALSFAFRVFKTRITCLEMIFEEVNRKCDRERL